MMWSKFDDQFYMNPKIAKLDRDEQDLYMAAIVYCNGQLTDGFIPKNVLPMLAAWSKIEANAQAIASRLVEHALLENADCGYQIHDFLDWNLSKDEVLELKTHRSEAGKVGGRRSAAVRQARAKANAKASAQASAQAKSKQNSTPSPSQSPIKSPRSKERGERDPNLDSEAVKVYRDIAKTTPNEEQRKEIVVAVTDVERWKLDIAHWIGHGWNKRNVTSIISFHLKGGIGSCYMCLKTNSNGNGNGAQPPKQRLVIRDGVQVIEDIPAGEQ